MILVYIASFALHDNYEGGGGDIFFYNSSV